MRAIAVSCLALICLLPAVAQPKSPSMKAEPLSGIDQNAYRHGATYRTLHDLDVRACQQSCNEDGACLAWSHVQGDSDTAAHCELKRGFGKREKNPRAVSGTSQTHAMFKDMMDGPDGLMGGDGTSTPAPEPEDNPESLFRGRN